MNDRPAPAGNPGLAAALRRHAYPLALAALLAAVALAYAQVSAFDFVDYDDNAYIYENAYIAKGLTFQALAWALTSFHAANWHPLTWVSHMVDVSLFGLWPGGHHLTSVAIHALIVWVLLHTLWELTGRFWPSVLVAGLFALHPLHVESVAWVSERKDLLCALFWMLCLLAYGRWAKSGGRRWYVAVHVFFALALASKPMAVTLPCVLLLLDHWPLGRWKPGALPRLFTEKALLWVMAAACSAVTTIAQSSQGAVGSLVVFTLPQRLANALVAYGGYLGKTLWPVDLAYFYPYPEEPRVAMAAAVAVVMGAVTLLAWRWRDRYPWLLVGWGWFAGMLVPVIGLVQVGMQAMADRYTYIPLVGVFIVAAWSLDALARRSAGWQRGIAVAMVAVLLAATLATKTQVGYWRDSGTLAERALAVTRDNYPAHTMAAVVYKNQGQMDAAKAHLAKAIAIYPQETRAVMLFGGLMEEEGQVEKAIAFYRLALELDPRLGLAHYRLGKIFLDRDEMGPAHWHLQQALRLDPEMAVAHNDFGLIQVARGNLSAAIYHFEQALSGGREFAEAQNNLTIARDLQRQKSGPQGRSAAP